MRGSEAIVGQDRGPNGMVGIWRLRDHPEALMGVMDDGDDLGS